MAEVAPAISLSSPKPDGARSCGCFCMSDEHLKALHDTLKAAAERNRTAHIGPKEARQGAEAIERNMGRTETKRVTDDA